MTLQYSLDEKDFLINLLYNNTNSELNKKRLFRSRILIPLIYVIIAASFIFKKNHITGIGFIVFAVLWFIFYPNYSKRRIKRYYIKYIKENFDTRIGVLSELVLNSEYIMISEKGSESKINHYGLKCP